TFAPWKVAISGLHQRPRFVPVGPSAGQPVLFDDTCYFISFAGEKEARIVADILNSSHCLDFMQSLMFRDAKRPITVELLQRLNLSAIAQDAGLAEGWARNPASELSPLRCRSAIGTDHGQTMMSIGEAYEENKTEYCQFLRSL